MDSAELARIIADALRASDRIADAHIDAREPTDGVLVVVTTQGGKVHEVTVK